MKPLGMGATCQRCGGEVRPTGQTPTEQRQVTFGAPTEQRLAEYECSRCGDIEWLESGDEQE